MNKLLLIIILSLASVLSAFAQADVVKADTAKYWTYGGFFNVNFNQAMFLNWSKGGENSIALTFINNEFANYKKGNFAWDNSFDASYGLIKTSDEFQKNEDVFVLSSKPGYGFKENWFASGEFTLISQFMDGFSIPESGDRELVSSFMAPGYLTIGTGIDYKPNEFFSLYLSPTTGKLTMVFHPDIDETAFGVKEGETIRAEFGALLKAKLNKDIVKNVNYTTILTLFNNYTNDQTTFDGRLKRANIDVDWMNALNLKVNKYITANILAHLIYDDDVKIPVDDDGDGNPDRTGPRTQFKEALGVGFSFKF